MGQQSRPEMTGHALAVLIDRVRHERGMSLRAVARAAGLAPSTVAALAGGRPLRQSPLPATLERLADALGLPLEDLQHAAAAAVRGQRIEIYRVRLNGGELEIRAALDPDDPPLSEAEVARMGEAAAKALQEGRAADDR